MLLYNKFCYINLIPCLYTQCMFYFTFYSIHTVNNSMHSTVFASHLNLGRCGVCVVAQLHLLTSNGYSDSLSELEYYTTQQWAQEVRAISTRSATVNNNNTAGCMIPIWDASLIKSHFLKWLMSNCLNLMTAMIKVKPIGMWMMQVKRRLPNSV